MLSATHGMVRSNFAARNGVQLTAPQTQTQQPQRRVKPSTVVYWMRVALGVLTGVAENVLQINQSTLGDFAIFVGIGLGVVIYLGSAEIVRHVLHYGEAELKGKNRYITLGGGSFIVMWIMVTVLLYTLFH